MGTSLLSSCSFSLYNKNFSRLSRKRLDKNIEDLDQKQDAQRETLGKMQQQLQQAQVKAAMKA